MARGPRVPLIAATSTWVCVLAEDPPDGVHPLSSGGDQGGGPVRAGRRAGHRQGVVVRLRAHSRAGWPPDESQRCVGWLTADGWRSTPPGVRAYSMDLRERVVAAVDAGLTQSQAAARFGV